MTTFTKDPAAVLDFDFVWTGWLASGETISTETVTVDAESGLVLGDVTETGGVVKAWLSAGSVGTGYQVTCQVTTSQGRTDERSMTIDVAHR